MIFRLPTPLVRDYLEMSLPSQRKVGPPCAHLTRVDYGSISSTKIAAETPQSRWLGPKTRA
jgi:hypothetical protein